jgi:hypothetical protein
MPTTKNRVNVLLGDRLSEATHRAARRKGVSASSWLRSLAIERLLADGEITDADLEADEGPDRRRKEPES